MKISDRFTDYGLVGGLFWLLQLALWFFANGPHGAASFLQLSNSLALVPTSFVPALSAIGLIGIFATGLLLDLVSTFLFQTSEVGVLAEHAREHDSWLKDICRSGHDYLENNWETLLSIPRPLLIYVAHFTPWKATSRDIIVHASFKMHKYRRASNRVHSFLLAYVHSAPGIDKLETLSTQMSFWSVVRAAASAGIIAGVEGFVIAARECFNLRYVALWNPMLLGAILLLILLLLYLPLIVALSAYDRYCETLFAFAYMVKTRTAESDSSPLSAKPS